MPVFRLTDELIFPHPSLANKDGLLAAYGDLSPQRLLLAYCNGIFPWYSEGDPILWWSPDPRFILYPKDIRISHSMRKILKKNLFKITYDTCFRDVITNCANIRKDTTGTWITDEMIEAYYRLHKLNFAHSVEAWYEDKLVGGLYGLIIGKCFFGESMFSLMSNASKADLYNPLWRLKKDGFLFIDCQVYTKHLESLGAVMISRDEYLKLLKQGIY